MKRLLIAIAALLASSILSAEQGNYILGPIDDAPSETVAPEIVPLREFSWDDLRLGLTMDEVERTLEMRGGFASNERRWGFKGLNHNCPDLRLCRISFECEQLVNAKSCTLDLGSNPGETWAAGKRKPAYLTIIVFEEKVIVIQFVDHPYRAEVFAEYAHGVSDSRPPASVDEGEMIWQEDGVMLSVRWRERPKIILLDTVKFAESQQAP